MTREDVKKLFPDASEEQITGLLNQNNSEIAREKAKAEKIKSDSEKWKTDAEKAEELQAKVEALENEKLTEEQKREKEQQKFQEELNKQMEQMKQANIDLQNQLNSERIKSYAGSKNLTGEKIDSILKSFGSNYELAVTAIDSMAELITERETAAALAKEQQIASASSNPGGQTANGGGEKSIADDMAIACAKRAANANEDIIKNYRR
jgi:hypothetical protein